MQLQSNYNPDVLSCLANLSNDEVFTPPTVVNQMLDMLPAELFRSSKTKFLDPVSKSGVFLREIAKRLMIGLEHEIPDIRERANHIFTQQLYGIAITELTSLISRRSVYCSKAANGEYSLCSEFNDEQGNIRYREIEHSFIGGKCKYCGASEDSYGKGSRSSSEMHAYEFIHTTKPEKLFENMKFDVIIGNPPYQMDDGGNAASAKPIYHHFVEQAKKMNPRFLCMIIPARWYAGGKGLDDFRRTMLNDDRIRNLVDYANSADCFSNVNIAGGVCYFLWCRDTKGICSISNAKNNIIESISERKLNEYPVFVRDNRSVGIIHKLSINAKNTLCSQVCSRNSFSLPSNERGHSTDKGGDLVMLSSDGKSYISQRNIVDRDKILNKYKVIITYAMSGGNKPSSNGDYQIISSPMILKPGEVCTETYLVIGSYTNKEEAKNLLSYLKTKSVRFFMLQALTSIHITKNSFYFVPNQDFSIPWTDFMIYQKYKFTEEEINLIESMIRPME